VPSIVALERTVPNLVHWSEQSYKSIFESGAPERVLWVIEDDGKLQAFLVARFSAAECELENLVVAAAHRRRGLASQLLQSLIASARERNTERILLEVRESNEAARALYGRFGFQLAGNRKAYYSQPTEDALLLVFWVNCTSSSAPER
jgi:[ribosomal protein S18]-alanine N-acetyltransferase